MQLIRSRQYTVEVPGFEAGEHFRLAFLSDLHNNVYPGLLKMLEEAAPDAVLIGGDMVNRPTRFGTPPRFTRGYGCVKRIAERFPVWYAPGNHEAAWKRNDKHAASYAAYRAALQKKGVRFWKTGASRCGTAAARSACTDWTWISCSTATCPENAGRRQPGNSGKSSAKLPAAALRSCCRTIRITSGNMPPGAPIWCWRAICTAVRCGCRASAV